MKFLENSSDRLKISVGFPKFNGAVCTLDRAGGRAIIERKILFFPLKTVDVPLGDIAFAQLTTTSGGSGETAYVKTYPEVFLKSGRGVPLATASEASSKKCVTAINAFLETGKASPSI